MDIPRISATQPDLWLPEQSLQACLQAELSRATARIVRAQPNQCYKNAWRALVMLPGQFFPDGRFIEGWTVFDLQEQVMILEHGWVEWKGKIIDPTIFFLTDLDAPVFFFPGVARSWQEIEALEGELFPHVRCEGYGPDGMDHPGYWAAYQAAQRKALALALVVAFPKEIVTHVAGRRDAYQERA
jgi:hypothetical protein